MRSLIAAIILVLVAAGTARAEDYRLGDLVVSGPWARASIGMARAGAAYLSIANRGDTAARLTAVATPAAEHSELHTNITDAGVAQMHRMSEIEIAPGEEVVLRPGERHVMLMGLTAPLEEGGRFPMTLTFGDAGDLEVEVEVEAATAMGTHGHGN